MNKEEQKKLLTEIMDADTKDGLYEPTVSKMETTQQKDHIGDTNKMVTAVEWLEQELKKIPFIKPEDAFKQSKAMEKEQLKEMYLKGLEDKTFKQKSKWTKVNKQQLNG